MCHLYFKTDQLVNGNIYKVKLGHILSDEPRAVGCLHWLAVAIPTIGDLYQLVIFGPLPLMGLLYLVLQQHYLLLEGDQRWLEGCPHDMLLKLELPVTSQGKQPCWDLVLLVLLYSPCPDKAFIAKHLLLCQGNKCH